jgi:hypothetical protein
MGCLKKIYHYLEFVSDIVSKLIEIIIVFLIASSAADLMYQVLYRFIIVKFFTISSPFTEEYARYAMIWLAYLGIVTCF